MNDIATSRPAAALPDQAHFAVERFHPIVQRALMLESRPAELLGYAAGKLPYWALIRLAVTIRLLDKMRGENSARDMYLRPRPIPLLRSLRYVAASLRRSPLRYRDKQLVFFCSGVNKQNDSGAYFNSRVDYFVNALPGRSMLLIEGADDLRYAWPRAVGPVSFRGGLTIGAQLRARMGRLRRAEDSRIKEFMALLAATFDGILDEADIALLEGYLRSSVLRSTAYHAACGRMLDRVQPRIVFLENAHSSFDVELVVAARERGIVTAEYQHGAINPQCAYHNFHPHLLASVYADCLPDYFLSYGDFWNPLLTTSARCISIGNPHVAAMRSRVPAAAPQPDSVYFLSSANAPDFYMKKMRELLAEGYSVLFRPHPIERPLLTQRYGQFFAETGIGVDLQHDFYSQIPHHQFVVGDGRSTALFEACAIAAGRVFIMETSEQVAQALPNHSFLKSIDSATDLRLRSNRADDVPADALFATDWQQRFSRFVASVLGE